MAGGLWLARRGAERHEVAVADTVAAVRALVLGGLPPRPAAVALAGGLAVGGRLPGVPPRGWRDAARSRRVTVNGEPWLARPLDEAAGEGLWALVPEGPRHAAERRFWFVWALSLVAATGVALVARATVSRSVGTGAVGAGSVVAGSARPPRAVGGLTKERSGSDTSNPGASGQVPDA